MIKKLLMVNLVFILISLMLPQMSKGAEICLAKLPDSAWDNGEPSIYQSEYPGIQSRKSGSSAPELISGGTKQMYITYEYIGENCSLRKITKNYELQIGFRKLNDEDLSILSKKSNLWNQTQLVESVTAYRKITTAGKQGLWSNVQINPEFNWGILKIPMPARLNGFTPLAEFQNDCGLFAGPFRDEWFRAMEVGEPIVKILKQPCELKISLVSTELLYLRNFEKGFFDNYLFNLSRTNFDSSSTTWKGNWDPNSRKLTLIHQVIELNTFLITFSIQKITLSCTKGKLTKTVTGINPKCPAGYKVKT